MRLNWHVPQPSARTYGKPPPLWIGLTILIVVQIVGAVITVLTWGPRPVASGDFFVRMLLLPLALSAALCGIVYNGHEHAANETDWWNYLCRDWQARWRRWAQARAVIVAGVTLTPEIELGERMLGLESPRPANAGKRLALANRDQASSEARLEGVLTDLLTPLRAKIAAIGHSSSLHISLRSASPDDLMELKQLWRRLHLPDLVTFSWLPLDAPLSLVEPWLDADRPSSDFELMLACQLHAPDQTPAWSEAAVALLATSSQAMSSYQGKLKPLAYLFRPIKADTDEVMDALSTLLRAQQAPSERIKHLWMSGLSGQSRHATVSAVNDNGLDLPVHDLDEAIGEPGHVSPLLLHALAAQMVQHGQGVQLVATPTPRGVQLNLVGTQLAPIERVQAEYYGMLSLWVTIGIIGIACLVLFGAETLGSMRPWLGRSVLAMVVLAAPIQIGGSLLGRRLLTDEFYASLQKDRV